MGSSIEKFNSNSFGVQFQTQGDTFVAWADGVAHALGFRDAANLLRGIPAGECGYSLVSSRTPTGGEHEVERPYLTESGFYRALGQRQAARITDEQIRETVIGFQDWVYGDVLPSIRKTGSYISPFVASHQSAIDYFAFHAPLWPGGDPRRGVAYIGLTLEGVILPGWSATREGAIRRMQEKGVVQVLASPPRGFLGECASMEALRKYWLPAGVSGHPDAFETTPESLAIVRAFRRSKHARWLEDNYPLRMATSQTKRLAA